MDESIGSIDGGFDASLTRLATFIEQHAEEMSAKRGLGELDLPDDIEDMFTLVLCARAAAALQPDATSDPAQYCKVILQRYSPIKMITLGFFW